MPGDSAVVFSAMIALGSVTLNLYGTLLSERKRADLQKEVRGGGCCTGAAAARCGGSAGARAQGTCRRRCAEEAAAQATRRLKTGGKGQQRRQGAVGLG